MSSPENPGRFSHRASTMLSVPTVRHGGGLRMVYGGAAGVTWTSRWRTGGPSVPGMSGSVTIVVKPGGLGLLI